MQTPNSVGARILDSLMPWTRSHETPSGAELVDTKGRTLPLRHTSVRATAGQGFARVVVEQRFVNPHDEVLSVTYRMPLPPEGAISGYAFTIGERKVVGDVRPRRLAREAYETAIAEGRTAGLLEQERANIFTQTLGNLPAKSELLASITVDMPLSWLPEGSWELRFPTVIGPRYVSGERAAQDANDVGVSVSKAPLSIRSTIEIELRDELLEGRKPESPSHTLASSEEREKLVRFANEEGEPLDRDLVVRWPVARAEVGLSIAVARPESGRPHVSEAYGVLTLVPPHAKAKPKAIPRDLVILIDTSGSMSGFPLESARVAVTLLLESLGEADRFELVAFSDAPNPFEPAPSLATPAARKKALAWMSHLEAGGSTEMHTAVIGAMKTLRKGSQRQVVLVTDGYIGGEEEIVRTLVESLPDSCRLHFVGVGSATNRSLGLAMARAGRGTETVVGIGEDPERVLARLIRGTKAPLLTNVTLSGTALLEHAPEHLPDVFADCPLRIATKLSSRGGELVVRGETAEGPWESRVTVSETRAGEGDPGAVALFARECVSDLETRISYGRETRGHDASIERLGVVFQISTRHTSWVAIDSRVSVDPHAKRRTESVPQEAPFGTTIEAFGLRETSDDSESEAYDLAGPSSVSTLVYDDVRPASPSAGVARPASHSSQGYGGVSSPLGVPRAALPMMPTSSVARVPQKRRRSFVWALVWFLILGFLVFALALAFALFWKHG